MSRPVLVLVAPALILAACTHTVASGRVTTSTTRPSSISLAACATRRSALMPAAALRGFREIVSNSFTTSPIKPGIPGSSSSKNPAITEFLKGTTIGYMSDLAFEKPFITYERAWESAHHYSVSAIPDVPLQGRSVALSKDLLEAYEFATVYSGHDGAVAFASYIERSVASSGNASLVRLRGPFSGDYAAVEYMGPVGASGFQAGFYEHELRVEVVVGKVEMDFAFRNGTVLDVPRSMTILRESVAAMENCRPS